MHKYPNSFPLRKKTQIKFSNLESLFHGGGGIVLGWGGVLSEDIFRKGVFPARDVCRGKGVGKCQEGEVRGMGTSPS